MKVILYYVIAFHKNDTTESFKTQSYHFIAWLAQNDEKAPPPEESQSKNMNSKG